MSLSSRVSTLAGSAVLAAGLAHAGWLWLAWSAADGAAAAVSPWWPVAAQMGWTLALAAAVVWQMRRSLRPLQHSAGLLCGQADALEQGRFVIVESPPLAELAPLARSLNGAVRRLQTVLEEGAGDSAHTLQRAARRDTRTGLDSRYTFLRRLTEQLAKRDGPGLSLLGLRLLAPGGAGPTAAADASATLEVAALLKVFPQRVEGAFVGRLGEADFALVLPTHGLIEETATSLMAAVAASPATSPCVVACLDHLDGASLGGCLALLDLALAEAEAGGAGQIVARSAQLDAVARAADTELRRRIIDALRSGDVGLASFAVIDARGALLHLECPMRLRLEQGGPFVPAQQWLAVAIRYRLVTQIELAGIELALAACARDGQARCVHVCAKSLGTAGFVSAVRARLEAAPLAASRLSIEIAELALERLPPRLRNAGMVWRRAGARVGIEHAGAALRGLLRLSQIELDYVKVDGDYVRELASDPAQRERAQGLVALVHEMGAQAIAEGVEDEADLAALWQIGFDGATGPAAVHRQAPSTLDPGPQAHAMSPT